MRNRFRVVGKVYRLTLKKKVYYRKRCRIVVICSKRLMGCGAIHTTSSASLMVRTSRTWKFVV